MVLTAAGAYFGTLLITKNIMNGLVGSCRILFNHQIAEMILARRNFKAVDKSLLEFLNQLGNFSAIQGEITNVLHKRHSILRPY